jgi:hypothetical protein
MYAKHHVRFVGVSANVVPGYVRVGCDICLTVREEFS